MLMDLVVYVIVGLSGLGLLSVAWALGALVAEHRGWGSPGLWPFTLAKAIVLSVFWVLYWPIHLLRTREERRAAARRWFYGRQAIAAICAARSYRAVASQLRADGYPLSAIAYENAADVMLALAAAYGDEQEPPVVMEPKPEPEREDVLMDVNGYRRLPSGAWLSPDGNSIPAGTNTARGLDVRARQRGMIDFESGA